MGKIEYLTTKLNGYLSFNDIFVLLATGDGSRGGYVSLTGSGYTDSKTAAVTGANNSKIVIGANFQSVDNISSVNYTVNHTTSALKFTGNGSVNFTAQTGSTTLGKNSALTDSKICLSAKNTLGGDVVASYYTGYDRSAYTIWATDILTVDSDLSVVLKATASTSVDKVYNDDNVTFKGNTKDHTANAAALKAKTILLEKNFTGVLTASASFTAKNSDTENVKATEISGNTAMASGFFADSLTVVGQFGKKNGSGRTGTISATLTATLDASNNADGSNGSLTNNTLGAYGLNITNDLNLTTIDAVISAGMNRVILKTAGTQDKTMVNASGNTVETIGIKAGNITAGTFDAQIKAESSNKTISYSGAPNTQWGTPKYRGYSLNTNLMAGLYATNISVTSGIMKGTIKVISVNDRITDRTFCSDIYGVYAGDKLSIANGRMDSNISISVSGGTGVYQVVGVKTKTFDVGVFNGTLTINNENGDVVEYNVGIWADSFASTSPINISGVIDFANSSYNVGIMSSSTLNLTISGKINAGFGEYAVFSGTRSMGSISRPGSNNNDNITIIRDARVVGDIFLTNGEDTVTIDNTASVNGEISSFFGTLNLELLLTEKVNSDFTLKNSELAPGDNTIIQVNLNRAVVGEYKLIEGVNRVNWSLMGTEISFRFGGKKQTVTFADGAEKKNIMISTDKGFVKGFVSIVGGNLTVTVEDIANNYEGLYGIKVKRQVFDADSKTWTLVWETETKGASSYWGESAVYELEYRIKNSDGTYATNWIRQSMSKASTYYIIKDGEAGQSVEWRIRVNDQNGTYYGAWTDSNSDFGTDPVKGPKGIQATSVINQTGENGGATSAVMCLQWVPKETTPFYGLKNYVIEYFSLDGDLKRFTQKELAENWDQLASGSTVYTRTTTANELYISGLVSTKSYYWRVKEIDDRGQESQWTIGATFGVETTDKEGPSFDKLPTVTQFTELDKGQGKEFRTITIKWDSATDVSGVYSYTITCKENPEFSKTFYVDPSNPQTRYSYTFVTEEVDTDYHFTISATDTVGNKSEDIEFAAYHDPFKKLKSALSVTWEFVDDPRGSNYAKLRQPQSLNLTLSIESNIAETAGIYYVISFYSDETCENLIFATPELAAASTISLTSANNLIAYISAYAEGLKRTDFRDKKSVPTVYWKVRAVDEKGQTRGLSQNYGEFKFFNDELDRPMNDYYAPDAPTLVGDYDKETDTTELHAVTEADLSKEDFSYLSDEGKKALKAYINSYGGSLFLVKWDPTYDGFGIKSYKVHMTNGKVTYVYDTYKDKNLLCYVSSDKVLGGVYDFALSGKWTFWVSAIDGSGLESKESNRISYTYFDVKSTVDGGRVSDILFQYTGGDNQLGFWMNGKNDWRGQGMAQPTDWEVKGAFDMNVDGKADIVLVGNVTVNGVKGAYIGYYDGGDTSKWVNIGYLTNMDDINWNVKVANITGTRGTSSIIWHDQDHGVLGVWTDGTDNWIQIKGGFSGDWVLKGAGDFNGDGKAEILFDYQGTFYTTDINGNLTNLGTGFGSAQGWEFAAIGDFSCDGQDDMILFNKENGLVVKLEDGLTKSWKKLGQLDANDWFVVGAGDYNGDKKDDLLVRQKSTGMLGYYDGGDFSKWREIGRGVDSNWTVIA